MTLTHGRFISYEYDSPTAVSTVGFRANCKRRYRPCIIAGLENGMAITKNSLTTLTERERQIARFASFSRSS